MLDAMGTPDTLLLLGGTSDIAVAVAEEYAAAGTRRVVLAARPSAGRDTVAARLRDRGLIVGRSLDFEAQDTDGHAQVLDKAWVERDVDVAVVAFGLLGDQEHAWQSQSAAVLAEVNFVGAVSVGTLLAQRMRDQGHGVIVALSSVAGERVRRSNFVYGATKAGMDGFFLGLGEAVRAAGVHVLVVRPGYVATRMTVGTDPAPFATTPERVARQIVGAVAERKDIVWVPGALRAVMSVLRHRAAAVVPQASLVTG